MVAFIVQHRLQLLVFRPEREILLRTFLHRRTMRSVVRRDHGSGGHFAGLRLPAMEVRWRGIPRRMSFAGYGSGSACGPPPAVINRGCMIYGMPPLPQLATYLGQVHIGATQRDLTMTPELLHECQPAL